MIAAGVLVDTGDKTFMGGTIYQMDLAQDTFIHFTLPERVAEILKEGRLLHHPPYPKFGGDAVYAISLTYGVFVPKVQTTRYKGAPLQAIRFKTTAIPKYGYVEEVVWEKDVPLIRPEVLGPLRARSFLPRPSPIGGDDMVLYQ